MDREIKICACDGAFDEGCEICIPKENMKIYVASSWRNQVYEGIVFMLRAAKFEVYDFRNEDSGFSWDQLDSAWKQWGIEQYLAAIKTPLAEKGFKNDFEAMKWADACVLVMPAGRSAHIEAGWFVGAKKPLHILLSQEKFEPDLMYKMATSLSSSPMELLKNLGVKD